MKVYNTRHLNNKQRFSIAIALGLGSAILCGLAFALITMVISMRFSILYVAMAYGVSYVIKKYGKGVQPKFSILGASCFILSVLMSYMFYYIITLGFDFSLFPYYFNLMFRSITTLNVNGIIEMMLIAYSTYVAFYNSRII